MVGLPMIIDDAAVSMCWLHKLSIILEEIKKLIIIRVYIPLAVVAEREALAVECMLRL
jgi:hypothetical protein